MPTKPWSATHEITFIPIADNGGPTERWIVMAHEGFAYTDAMWMEGTEPEWIVDEAGNFHYDGKLDAGTLRVRKLT